MHLWITVDLNHNWKMVSLNIWRGVRLHTVQFDKAVWRRFWGLCIKTVFCFMWTFFFPNTPTRTCTHQGARRGNDCLSVLAGGGGPFRVRSACGNYSAQFRPTPPATPLSCGCSSQKMLNTTSLLICSPSDVLLPPTHQRRGGRKSAFLPG